MQNLQGCITVTGSCNNFPLREEIISGYIYMNKQAYVNETKQDHYILYIAMLIVSLLHLPLSVYPVGRDQGVWATAGMAIKHGSVFYKNYLHFNLPGLAFSYALVFEIFNDPRTATMFLSLASSIFIITGMYMLLTKTVNKTAASWSVILFAILWPMKLNFWTIAQKDFMAMYGVIIGTGLLANAETKSRWSSAAIYFSGIFAALSAMYKPIFAFAGLLMALILASRILQPIGSVEHTTQNQWAINLRNFALFVSGVLTIALIFMLYLVAGEAVHNFYNGIFVVAPIYSKINNKTLVEMFVSLALRSSLIPIQFGWLKYLLIWIPVMLIGIMIVIKKAKTNNGIWLIVPFLTAIFTFFVQRKAISYHSSPWQICEFIVAGCFFERCLTYARAKSFKAIIARLVLILTLGLILGHAFLCSHYVKAEIPAWLKQFEREDYLKNNFLMIGPETGVSSPIASEKTSEWLRQNSLPEDKILVWGLECQIYVLSSRMFATHSPFDFLLTADLSADKNATDWQTKMRLQFINQLIEEKPKYLIIVNNDINAFEPLPSNESLALIPGFKSLIAKQYCKIKRIELFDIYQLNL